MARKELEDFPAADPGGGGVGRCSAPTLRLGIPSPTDVQGPLPSWNLSFSLANDQESRSFCPYHLHISMSLRSLPNQSEPQFAHLSDGNDPLPVARTETHLSSLRRGEEPLEGALGSRNGKGLQRGPSCRETESCQAPSNSSKGPSSELLIGRALWSGFSRGTVASFQPSRIDMTQRLPCCVPLHPARASGERHSGRIG